MSLDPQRSPAMAWGPASVFTAGLDFPRVAPVRQRVDATAIADPHAHVRDGVTRRLAASDLTGKSIGVTVGSRGISHLPQIIRGVIDGLRARGANPFIVPAMGSHGGATAEGQTEVMAGYGISEASEIGRAHV